MPDIVYVDDKPQAFLDLVQPQDRGRFDAHDPQDGEAAYMAAGQATVWLFDYFYDDNSDQARPPGENGLSTFQKWRSAVHEDRPVTAVVSNNLPRALGDDIPTSRSHVLAIRAGVEWVGPKTAASARSVLLLADASHKLSGRAAAWLSSFPDLESRPASVDTETLCFELLAAPAAASWRTSVVRYVDRARPPRLTAGIAPLGTARSIIGWLLHAVLPYQSFLLSSVQVAVRLGVTLDALNRLRSAESELATILQGAEYEGPLALMSGQRWWRAGIDNLVWQLSSGDDSYRAAFAALAKGAQPEFLNHDEPVIVCNADLVETGEIAEARDCVRAQNEDFPADVPPAWVTIASVRDDRLLRAKVIFEDRDLLNEFAAA